MQVVRVNFNQRSEEGQICIKKKKDLRLEKYKET